METVFLAAFVFVAIGAIWYLLTIYNGLVGLRNDMNKAWANIDVLLKQRHDEVGRLVEVCQGYMTYERELFEQIALARSGFLSAASVDQKAQADQSLAISTHTLLMRAENYPRLRANEGFLQLQARITELENAIADRREFYNDAVNSYNIRVQQMPDAVVAGVMGLQPREMLRAAAR
jgi:LemA protein